MRKSLVDVLLCLAPFSTPRLVISWTGGNNRFIVQIYELKGGTRGALVYDQRNVASRRLIISTRIFKAGKKYQLNIQNTTGRFTVTGRTITGSEIQFQQHAKTYFYID